MRAVATHTPPSPGLLPPGTLLTLTSVDLPVDPLPPARDDEPRRRARALARRAGLLTRRNQATFDAFSGLAGAFYPTATGARALACSAFVNWLFFVDDLLDDRHVATPRAAVLVAHLVDTFRSGPAAHHGAVAALADGALIAHTAEVVALVQPQLGARSYARFCGNVERYLRSALDGSLRHAAGRAPNLRDYLDTRIHDSGSLPCIRLLEAATGHGPEGPDFDRLEFACAAVLALTNDLFSYGKELEAGVGHNNLLSVLMAAERVSVPEAFEVAARTINAHMRELREGLAALPPDLRPWGDGLLQLVKANNAWSLMSPRYRSPSSPFVELRP